MKVAALISGGKDSFYNMMCCQNVGHEIVCLGNLYPPAVGEIDSYMYQSVGSEGIETIAKALDLPLIRQEIRGTPKNLEMTYTKENGDEVEDLHLLMTKILERYPDVKGVSVGAINSTYQKVRVENICERFGIVPLCLLWERNQLELLDEMIGSGINAILIKVAAMGLNSEHLSKNLSQMKEHLLKMHEKYGSHVCGEGGEYESFVLDSPLHKKRIEIVDKETVIHDKSDVAPVAYLRLNKLALVENIDDAIVPPTTYRNGCAGFDPSFVRYLTAFLVFFALVPVVSAPPPILRYKLLLNDSEISPTITTSNSSNIGGGIPVEYAAWLIFLVALIQFCTTCCLPMCQQCIRLHEENNHHVEFGCCYHTWQVWAKGEKPPDLSLGSECFRS